MAKPVYSVNLISEDLTVGAVVTYEVPENVTVVVRDCQGIVNPGPGSAASVTLSINGYEVWTFGSPAQIPRRIHEEGRYVAPGPSTLELVLNAFDTSATAAVTVNGYYLT